MPYKWCSVPLCTNTSNKTPEKLFVSVPKDLRMRKKWLKLAHRNPKEISNTSNVFFCEDHFNLEKDVSNYTQYKMGYSQRMVMVKGVVPTKFDCQEENRKRLGDASASSFIGKRPKTGQSQESDDNISVTDEDNSDVQNDDLEITNSVSEYLNSDDDLHSVSSDSDSPASMKVCRICLAMNVKMYHISENNLSAMYEIITGGEINIDDKLPQMLCWECVSRLTSCKNFIEKAQKTQWILKNLTQEDRLITENDIKLINKDEYGLNSTLCAKVYNINDANLHIIEEIVQNDNKNCKNAESQTEEYVPFIKTESSDEEDEIHNTCNQEEDMGMAEEYIEDEIKSEDEDVTEEPISCGVGIDPLENEEVDEGDEESIAIEKVVSKLFTPSKYGSNGEVVQSSNKNSYRLKFNRETTRIEECIREYKKKSLVINKILQR